MVNSTADLLKLHQALEASHVTRDTDDDEGGSTTGGQGGVTVEKRLFVEMFGLIRAEEKQFGIAHEFDQLAYLAKANPNPLSGELGQRQGNGLKSHPILSHLSKFDGDTPNMSMDPTQNTDAQERYENKLQLQLQNQPNNRPSAVPTLKPM